MYQAFNSNVDINSHKHCISGIIIISNYNHITEIINNNVVMIEFSTAFSCNKTVVSVLMCLKWHLGSHMALCKVCIASKVGQYC